MAASSSYGGLAVEVYSVFTIHTTVYHSQKDYDNTSKEYGVYRFGINQIQGIRYRMIIW